MEPKISPRNCNKFIKEIIQNLIKQYLPFNRFIDVLAKISVFGNYFNYFILLSLKIENLTIECDLKKRITSVIMLLNSRYDVS